MIDSKCGTCHADGNIAPFAMTTYAEVAALVNILPSAIESRSMPPWPPEAGCNEYRHDRSLSEGEEELLTTWLADGAPEGDPADEPAAEERADTDDDFVADVTLTMAEPYTPVTAPDEYRCFVLPWEEEAPYVTGFRVLPGQPSIVHHVIAFAVEPDQVEQVQALDAADEGPGYPCFGGSGVPRTRWIGTWAPGGGAEVYPAQTGVRLDPGSLVVMQIHYNTAVSAPIADSTSIEMTVAEAVERPLLNQAILDPGWVFGTEPMEIPAGDPDVTHSVEVDLSAAPWSDLLSEIGIAEGEDVLVHAAGLHMHQLGVRSELRLLRAGAEEECMVKIPAWDFGWQGSYEFTTPMRIRKGDKLSLQCWWDNSESHQPIIDGKLLDPIDVGWGEGTRDEMCIATLRLSRP
ncbi:MAG: hypothetical protein R3A79_25115 [Nannocystaceae bacterium]